MKLPQRPPARWEELLSELATTRPTQFVAAVAASSDPNYLSWDRLRHRRPPEGLSREEWWATIKLARASNRRSLTLRGTSGRAFSYQLNDAVLRGLHFVDQNASGQLSVPEGDVLRNPQTKSRYLFNSLLEEAITSSQLEGAATTRARAKEIVRKGLPPQSVGERMIVNNFRAMESIREWVEEPLTPALVQEIHSIVTDGTLGDEAVPPYFRVADDGVGVFDGDGQLLHMPPHASEIPGRLDAMCAFANANDDEEFVHPVVRSILLHFWLAHDHPFVDGNGRTARALFYWSMLRHGYWLIEYISISRILKRAPAKYALSFLDAEMDENDATYFVLAQLDVIERAVLDLHAYVARKGQEVRDATELLRSTDGLNHRQVALITHALRNPGADYTIEGHRSSHAVTYQTARADLLGLEAVELLRKRRVGRAFHFRPAEGIEARLRDLGAP